ncbi:MAG: PolC-type DNA polymerase III [Bacilli bacterium]|nr:PolC-type DNA polymerase III [Bacilli bacterium]
MQDKLEILLKQIDLGKEKWTFFKEGALKRIVGSKDKTSYLFEISLKKAIPLDLYLECKELLPNAFPSVQKVGLCLFVESYTEEDVTAYYQYFIRLYKENAPLLAPFVSAPLTLENNILRVEANNRSEEMKFHTILRTLCKDLERCGFPLQIETFVNKEKSEANQKEIEKELLEEAKRISEMAVPTSEPTPEEPKKKFVPKGDFKRKPLIQEPDNAEVVIGRMIDTQASHMKDVVRASNNVTLEAYIFAPVDVRETRTGLTILTLKMTDYTDSMYGKIFVNEEEEVKKILKHLKQGKWFKMRGLVKDDQYSKELTFNVRDINILVKEEEKVVDTAPVKRVELHAHTKMSQMDGVVDAKTLLKTAQSWGHKALAITDHNGVQGFVEAYHYVRDVNRGIEKEEDKFKGIYGTELLMIDDSVDIVLRPNDSVLLDNTYVVFDFETTGFNAGGGDTIIEVGAVKIKDGVIIEKYDELINPGRPLPAKIIEITQITDAMLADKDNEENAIKRFIEWYGDLPLVAHNAKFDVSFLEMALKKYNLGSLKNPVIDTLELSRTMDNNFARHSLSALVKRYSVPFDETAHHRGDYDAEGTALVFHKMMKKLDGLNLEKMTDLDKLVSKDEIHKYGRGYHINILTRNKVGLKNLFKIISLANTTYLYKTPRILRSKIEEYREGLFIGSGCYEGEVFREASSKSEEELTNIINFYDYVEVQPPACYDHLLQNQSFASKEDLLENIRKVIRGTKNAGKIIVATGDVHHLRKEDKVYREIIVNQKVPGGGRHPLARNNITDIPSMHLRTTDEMLEEFAFLGKEEAYEIVVENTNKIADMIEIIEVIIETGGIPFSPEIANSVETVTNLVYTKAKEMYGEPLPYNIEERIAKELYGDGVFDTIKENLKQENLEEEAFLKEAFERLHEVILKGDTAVKALLKENMKANAEEEIEDKELDKMVEKKMGGIIGGHFDVIYLISQKLVKHSNDDGYLVGSRGSVGSSFVATLMGITEVNPLPAHYMCPNCKHSIFELDGKALGATYSSGFDLPDHDCPKCSTKMIKDGNDMPFATFLGFNADKVPDIDLNFSDLNQASAHEYTKVLFGVDNVYRAGTIGTVAEKTAFGYVKGYCEDRSLTMRTAEVERLAMGCTGVKRTTGQHPGGIVVIPGYMDVFDFTPFQFPADDPTSAWRTTHFDYHAIDEDVLKLDILGHSDPTQLRMIQDFSGMDITKVPLDDKPTMNIFLSPEPLGVTKEQILNETGTLGIPEFGTNFTIGMLVDTKPKSFAELIKISGLSHGTDVWLGNAQELIRNKVVPFKDVIGCRDDIMVYLMYHGLKPIRAFKIMEFVRKGRASKDPATWADMEAEMKEAGIEEWFIKSCQKIKYMFPKAHATAYVTSAFRIAYFKVHHPVWYYASWFTSKATDVDVEAMVKGYDAIRSRFLEIQMKGNEATNKERGTQESLQLALEATARGVSFANVDIYKSQATVFGVKDDKTIYPPFSSIEGLGYTVAKKIVEEREKGPFLSIEDFQKRAKASGTIIDKMRMMGLFEGWDESSQLSLF